MADTGHTPCPDCTFIAQGPTWHAYRCDGFINVFGPNGEMVAATIEDVTAYLTNQPNSVDEYVLDVPHVCVLAYRAGI